MRRGFTLVETLVALVLVQFGLLAVAAMSGVAARDVATATRISSARDVARERVERLRAGACGATLEGSASTPALTEHWSIRGDSIVRFVRDSVEYRLPAGRRGRIVIEQAVLCG
jgi:Tfp pilus assembly protein PilV